MLFHRRCLKAAAASRGAIRLGHHQQVLSRYSFRKHPKCWHSKVRSAHEHDTTAHPILLCVPKWYRCFCSIRSGRSEGDLVHSTIRPVRSATMSRTFAALICIIVLGFAIRLVGVDWDDGRYMHPDERHIVIDVVAGRIDFSWPPSLTWLDPEQSPIDRTLLRVEPGQGRWPGKVDTSGDDINHDVSFIGMHVSAVIPINSNQPDGKSQHDDTNQRRECSRHRGRSNRTNCGMHQISL